MKFEQNSNFTKEIQIWKNKTNLISLVLSLFGSMHGIYKVVVRFSVLGLVTAAVSGET